jgi:hypothetical protein
MVRLNDRKADNLIQKWDREIRTICLPTEAINHSGSTQKTTASLRHSITVAQDYQTRRRVDRQTIIPIKPLEPNLSYKRQRLSRPYRASRSARIQQKSSVPGQAPATWNWRAVAGNHPE